MTLQTTLTNPKKKNYVNFLGKNVCGQKTLGVNISVPIDFEDKPFKYYFFALISAYQIFGSIDFWTKTQNFIFSCFLHMSEHRQKTFFNGHNKGNWILVKKSCTFFSKYFGNFSSKQNILVIFSVKTNAKNILTILVQKKIY